MSYPDSGKNIKDKWKKSKKNPRKYLMIWEWKDIVVEECCYLMLR